LFSFGGELFLQVVAWQLLVASHVVIISKFLGLEAAGVYAVCGKIFSLIQQAVWRVFDYSVAAFSEMVVREEWVRLRDRFRDMWVISSSLAVATAIIVAACNQSFVALWTHGKTSWNPLNDWLMALSLVAFSITRVHGILAWVGKNVRIMRYIYLLEAVAFIISGSIGAIWYGLPGILIASTICNVAISGTYGLIQSSRYLKVEPSREMLNWLRPTCWFALAALPVALAVWLPCRGLAPKFQLAVNASALTILILGLFWKLGLRQNIRLELARLWLRRSTSAGG
jgi:hypothetical protein